MEDFDLYHVHMNNILNFQKEIIIVAPLFLTTLNLTAFRGNVLACTYLPTVNDTKVYIMD